MKLAASIRLGFLGEELHMADFVKQREGESESVRLNATLFCGSEKLWRSA